MGAQLQKALSTNQRALTFADTPLREVIVGDVQRPLLVMLGAVGFVLLVACANVANLLLARGSARHGELSVRAAIGAGRGPADPAAGHRVDPAGPDRRRAGPGLALLEHQALIAARPADLPRIDDIRLDGTVVWFTFGAALITSLVFGLVPALQATNEHLLRGLQESGRSSGGGGARIGCAPTLVVAEMALAVVLLTGAGLLIRSFIALTQVDPGFQPGGAMTLRVTLPGRRVPERRSGARTRRSADRALARAARRDGRRAPATSCRSADSAR